MERLKLKRHCHYLPRVKIMSVCHYQQSNNNPQPPTTVTVTSHFPQLANIT